MDFSYFGFYVSGSTFFVLVMAICELLFSINFARKSKFVARFVVGNIVAAAIGVPLSLVLYYLDFAVGNAIISNLYAVVMYLAMFMATVAVMKLSYREQFLRCLASAVMAYICHHISNDIFSVINAACDFETRVIVKYGNVGYLLSLLLQFASAAAVLIVTYFLLVKRARMFSPDCIIKRNVLFLVFAALAVALIMKAVGDVVSNGNRAVTIYIKCFSVLASVFMLFIYAEMLERKETEKDLDTVMQINRLERKHYAELKNNMDLINLKCHDIKHYIATAGKDSGVDLSELKDCVSIYDDTVKTGNEVIDALLTERKLYCSAHGIELNVTADASALDFVSVTDMCALFGNMLENAIEAVDKVKDAEKRTVDVNIRPIAGQVSIGMENNYEVDFDTTSDGLPISVKSDSDRHGFGMKSMRLAAEKYGGVFSYTAKDGIFRVSVLIPIPIKQ